ncbi:hypothetical protein K0M31_003921 [Melipona bicolor]|uniref:Uncharacterized protein n=1 Tax=Melipona bicolor TaxID=60889 RepID=A0AA40KP23_9HYME|nr:hypothetical protein K0M31_003921 [Melipona bicolor]
MDTDHISRGSDAAAVLLPAVRPFISASTTGERALKVKPPISLIFHCDREAWQNVRAGWLYRVQFSPPDSRGIRGSNFDESSRSAVSLIGGKNFSRTEGTKENLANEGESEEKMEKRKWGENRSDRSNGRNNGNGFDRVRRSRKFIITVRQ